MNIVQVQDQLKNFSQDQLVREMQMPSGNTPQYLVLSEIMRRQRMQADSAAQQGKGQPQTTVADEAIAAAGVPQGGIADMARALAPKTDMAENTGVQAMAKGGSVKKMAKGDKVVRSGITYIEQEDGTYLSEDGRRRLRSAGQDLRSGIGTLMDLPSSAGTALGGVSAGMADQMNTSLTGMGDTAMRAQMGEDALSLRAGPDTSYRYPEVPAVDVSAMDRVGMALEGRSGFPTGIEERSFGQRYIGDPLRSMFQPIGEAAREVGQPIGEAAREVGQPVGDAAREFFNPQAMVGPGAGRAGFPSVRTYTPEQLAVMAAAQPSATPPIISDIDSPYRQRIAETARTMEELRAERAAGAVPAPEVPMSDRRAAYEDGRAQGNADPLAALVDPVFSGLSDFGGALAGRTVEEQAAIDAARATANTTPRVDRDQQGIAAIPTPAEIAAEKEAVATTTTDTSGGTGAGGAGGTGAGGAGGAGAAGGMSSYEQELMDALGRREKAANQDKWLALAQVGLNLMASTNPTFGGALGEAGIKGVEAVRGARDQYDKDRLELLGALEQSRMARAAASAKAARGGAGDSIGLSAGAGRLLTQIGSDIERLDTFIADATLRGAATPDEEMALQAARSQRAAKAALYDNILYGAGMGGGVADDTMIDAADTE